MQKTYRNPVYPGTFADPFVLRHEGMYDAYGTAPGGAGNGSRNCVDFVELSHDHRIGTGIVVDRLLDMSTLAGEPRTAVLHRDGMYWCFYSRGAWERENYGVSYVVARHPEGPYRRPEGGHEALLMRTPQSGEVVGSGHDSFTASPDGSETWVVYHAWDRERTTRRMCIDRMEWVDGKPVTSGPTWTAQRAPSS
jgi:GH43 family beta-xylosidase